MIPDLSVLWVIFFVLLAVWVVNALLLKPLVRIMHEREHAITTARQLADKAAAEAAAAAAQFEARTTARHIPPTLAQWTPSDARGNAAKSMSNDRNQAAYASSGRPISAATIM